MRAARGPRPPEEQCRGLAPQDAGLGIVFLREADAVDGEGSVWVSRRPQRGGHRCQEVGSSAASSRSGSRWHPVKPGKLLGLIHPDSGSEGESPPSPPGVHWVRLWGFN